MRTIRPLTTLTVLAFLATGVIGAGSIDTTGATLTPGAAPSQGELIEDPCAPEATPPTLPPLGDLGEIGTFSDTLPAFPGAGTGVNGAFHATVANPQVLSPGTSDFTSFTIDPLVTVNIAGAVTINVTGDVVISGFLDVAEDTVIRCGGDFKLMGVGVNEARLSSGGDLVVFVGKSFLGSGVNSVQAVNGSSTVTTHAEGGAASNIGLADTVFESDSGILLQAADGITVDGGSLDSDGPVILRAFGGNVAFQDGGFARSSTPVVPLEPGESGVLAEASGRVEMTNTSRIEGQGADVEIRAFGGDVTLDDFSEVRTFDGGAVDVKASVGVELFGGSGLATAGGTLQVIAFGGDVEITGVEDSAISGVSTSGALTRVWASGSVKVDGSSYLTSSNGNLEVRAHAGDFEVTGDAQAYADGAEFDARAGNKILVSGDNSLSAGFAVLSSGAGGIEVGKSGDIFTDGTFSLLSEGPVRVSGGLFPGGDVSLVSLDDGVDVSSSNIATDDFAALGMARDSGDIVIESYGGSSGTINARNATLTTGSSDTVSGSIILRVYSNSTTVESFFLPKRVVVKANDKSPEKSKVLASGFFDLGPEDVDLTAPATLEIGGLVENIPGMIAKGSKFQHTGDGIVFVVVPAKSGSSRGKFKLKRIGDFTGQIDPQAEITIRFTNDSVDGSGTVALTGGKFKFGKNRGTLFDPNLYPAKLKAKLLGAGKDKLLLLVGLSTEGGTPAALPDFTVAFGGIRVTIAGDSFTKNGERLVYQGDTDGIKQVRVDYSKEKITIKGSGLTLREFDDGPNSIEVEIGLGEDTRLMRGRAAKKGKSLKY